VHHRKIQINHQPDATIFQFIILTFFYSSTCFGRSPAHHQALMTGVAARPRTQHGCYHDAKVKPEAATPVMSSWWWAGEHPKHVELQINIRTIKWKTVASGWWFIWIVRWCTDLQTLNLKMLCEFTWYYTWKKCGFEISLLLHILHDFAFGPFSMKHYLKPKSCTAYKTHIKIHIKNTITPLKH
jgi:hypothetical protein